MRTIAGELTSIISRSGSSVGSQRVPVFTRGFVSRSNLSVFPSRVQTHMCKYIDRFLVRRAPSLSCGRRIFLDRNKAVSSGAVSFYLDSFITSRVSRFTYGSLACVAYNPNDPRHFQRAHRVVTHRVTGALVLEGKWVPILQKVSMDSCHNNQQYLPI